MPDKDRIEIPIDITSIKAAIEQPLAFIDAPERRAAVQTYLDSASVFLERAVIDFLSSVADTLSVDAGLRARVEYRQQAPCFVIERHYDEEPASGQPFVEGDLEKVTIRLPADLKSMIDRLANGEGVSANSFYIRELARTMGRFARDARTEERRRPRGNRGSLKGYVGGE